MQNKDEKKQMLVFGYGLPVICALIAWRQYVKHGGITLWVIILATVGLSVLILALLKSPWLKTIFVYWMKGAKFIGSILTVGILTIIYGLVFTPVALCLRFLGKDYMRRKRSIDARSYWMDRLPEGIKQQTQQF